MGSESKTAVVGGIFDAKKGSHSIGIPAEGNGICEVDSQKDDGKIVVDGSSNSTEPVVVNIPSSM